MMKPMIPTAKGGLHPALFDGCGLWKPISVPAGNPEKATHPVNGVMDSLPLGDSVAYVGLAATSAKAKP